MFYDNTPDAPWIGKCREEYFEAFDKEEVEEEDEDMSYELWRDRQMENEE